MAHFPVAIRPPREYEDAVINELTKSSPIEGPYWFDWNGHVTFHEECKSQWAVQFTGLLTCSDGTRYVVESNATNDTSVNATIIGRFPDFDPDAVYFQRVHVEDTIAPSILKRIELTITDTVVVKKERCAYNEIMIDVVNVSFEWKSTFTVFRGRTATHAFAHGICQCRGLHSRAWIVLSFVTFSSDKLEQSVRVIPFEWCRPMSQRGLYASVQQSWRVEYQARV